MIPQLLQPLYGYRAIDAGLVLGPGAFVITLLAPPGAQLVQRHIIQPRLLLFGAVLVVGITFLHYSHFNLETDYNHYAWARALQGLGYAFSLCRLRLLPIRSSSRARTTRLLRLPTFSGTGAAALVSPSSPRCPSGEATFTSQSWEEICPPPRRLFNSR